jgi:hypothetical protein
MTADYARDEWAFDEKPTRSASAHAGPEPYYPDAATWVTDWLAATVRRPVNEKRAGQTLAWCPRWWAHSEAVERLEATWRAWEAARLGDPEAPARWWLGVLDPMLGRLMDPHLGPFAQCYRDGHTEDLAPLPVDRRESGRVVEHDRRPARAP